MSIRNTASKYGLVSKVLHWLIAILFILQFYWIYMKKYWLPDGSKTGIRYLVYYHKSIGTILLGIAVLFVIWKFINKKPAFPKGMLSYEVFLAKLTHLILSIVILVMPLSGVIMSMGSGRQIRIFDTWVVPQLIEKNKILASNAHAVHEWCSYIVIAAVSLHVLAALKHHFINKDDVLRRMLIS